MNAGPERVRILGTPLSIQRFDDAIERLVQAASGGPPIRAHFCTVHTVVEATSNRALRSVFESADMLAMDGLPLVWVARRKGARHAERVCGPDVMLALADRGRRAGLRHYFLGGAPGVPDQLARALADRYPGLEVVGATSPPFGPMPENDVAAIVADIESASPDILWIGIGSPRQEIWAAELQARLEVSVILPVGAAFDFHSGRVRRAPRWMQRSGLEWMFRLAMSPRRLARRYLGTNLQFIWLLARDAVARRAHRTS